MPVAGGSRTSPPPASSRRPRSSPTLAGSEAEFATPCQGLEDGAPAGPERHVEVRQLWRGGDLSRELLARHDSAVERLPNCVAEGVPASGRHAEVLLPPATLPRSAVRHQRQERRALPRREQGQG